MRNAAPSVIILAIFIGIFLFGCTSIIGEEKFTVYLFEKEKKTGEPLSGTLYCARNNNNNYQLIGPLENGSLTMNKTAWLEIVGSECNLSVKGKYKGYDYEFCGWSINESYIDRYDYYSSFPYWNSTDVQFRHGACSSLKSFVTPNDPSVINNLNRYLPNKTNDTYRDLDTILRALAKDFNYTYDNITSNYDDWAYFPSEFFKTKPYRGDCEDWSVAFLSMALRRESTPCYGVRLSFRYSNNTEGDGHVAVLCTVNGEPRVYDQGSIYKGGLLWEREFYNIAKGQNYSIRNITITKVDAFFNDTYFRNVEDKNEMYALLKVKEPEPTEFEKAMVTAYTDKTKLLLYLTEGEEDTRFSGYMTFISDSGTKRFYVPGHLLVEKNEICDGNKMRYGEINVTFDDSPVGETWKWDNISYCNNSDYRLWVNDSQMVEIKDARLMLYVYERPYRKGTPISGKVYCDNKLIGTLENGMLNASKVSIIGMMGDDCRIDVAGKYQGSSFEICGWMLKSSDVRQYSYQDFNLADGAYISDYKGYSCIR